MENCVDRLIKVCVFVLVTQFLAAGLSGDVAKSVDSNLKANRYFADKIQQILDTMNGSELIGGFEVKSFFGSTPLSVNFHVTRLTESFIAKLIKETDKSFATCQKLEGLQKNANLRIS